MDEWVAVKYEKQKQRLVASQVRMVWGHRRREGEGIETKPKKEEGDGNKQEKSWNGRQKEKRVSPDGTQSSSLKAYASVTPTYEREQAHTHTQSPAASLQAEFARRMQNLFSFSSPVLLPASHPTCLCRFISLCCSVTLLLF